MSNQSSDYPIEDQNLHVPEAARSLLDQLLEDSRRYTSTKDDKELLDFVYSLRNFAPLNAMLPHRKKAGLG